MQENDKAVISTKIYSPQNFIERLTGNSYVFNQNDTINEIHNLLKLNGIEDEIENTVFDYPLDEIVEIIDAEIYVVLVDVSYIDENCKLINEYRWFEVHDHLIDKFRED